MLVEKIAPNDRASSVLGCSTPRPTRKFSLGVFSRGSASKAARTMLEERGSASLRKRERGSKATLQHAGGKDCAERPRQQCPRLLHTTPNKKIFIGSFSRRPLEERGSASKAARQRFSMLVEKIAPNDRASSVSAAPHHAQQLSLGVFHVDRLRSVGARAKQQGNASACWWKRLRRTDLSAVSSVAQQQQVKKF
jgi:hypothetical protein